MHKDYFFSPRGSKKRKSVFPVVTSVGCFSAVTFNYYPISLLRPLQKVQWERNRCAAAECNNLLVCCIRLHDVWENTDFSILTVLYHPSLYNPGLYQNIVAWILFSLAHLNLVNQFGFRLRKKKTQWVVCHKNLVRPLMVPRGWILMRRSADLSSRATTIRGICALWVNVFASTEGIAMKFGTPIHAPPGTDWEIFGDSLMFNLALPAGPSSSLSRINTSFTYFLVIFFYSEDNISARGLLRRFAVCLKN